MINLEKINITELKGVGENIKNRLYNNDIFNLYDLLTKYPTRYENYEITDIANAYHGEKITFEGTIVTQPTMAYIRSNLNKMSFSVSSNDEIIKVTVFNRQFLFKHLEVGSVVIISGKIDKWKYSISASNLFLKKNMKKDIIPKYNLKDVNDGTYSNLVKYTLENYYNLINEILPFTLIEKYKLDYKRDAIYKRHLPDNGDDIVSAFRRYKYEELLLYQLKLHYLKKINRVKNNGYLINYNIDYVKDIIKGLPFELTKDQQNVTNEIFKDLKSSFSMNRLLQGDVGSGKTIVALLAILATNSADEQSAFMVPTEVLARQHYNNICNMFGKYLNIKLLTSSISKVERKEILDDLKTGKIDLLIGTHALYQEDVIYHNLKLIIIDEQHRFGVNQRKLLLSKSSFSNVLYMSATPIPRTLALAIYGDMDVSSIEEMPKGRQTIDTVHYKYKDIEKSFKKIKKHLDSKNQVYIISPLIEENDNELKSVEKLENDFNQYFKDVYKISSIHSKKSIDEKEEIMDKFVSKEIDILISTTVIEVGIDNPNATLIVIYDADRFGLSQLHQLRGRVGRSNLKSECILISDLPTELAEKRIEIITKENNGFKLSEEDMKLRGPGDFFGLKQSGIPSFNTANLIDDYNILLVAKDDAYKIINQNLFNTLEYSNLKKTVLDAISFDKIAL